MQARSDAPAQNQAAVIAQQLARTGPRSCGRSGGAGNVDHMVVLTGADGVAELLTTALATGGTGLGLARRLPGAMSETPGAGGPGKDGSNKLASRRAAVPGCPARRRRELSRPPPRT